MGLLVPNKKNYNEDKRPIVTNRKIVIPQNNFQEIADVDEVVEETKDEVVEEAKEESVEEIKQKPAEEEKEEVAEEEKEEVVEETKEEVVEETKRRGCRRGRRTIHR